MKKIVLVSLFVLLIGGISVSSTSVFCQTVDLDSTSAPHFELRDLQGKVVNSQDFIGKQPVLLIFWATW